MSTTTQTLDAGRWAEYFDSLTPSVEGLPVTVEVMSGELGDQLEVDNLAVQTIGYDHKDDVVEVAVEGPEPHSEVLRHFISAPREISVEQEDGLPSSILVTAADGVRTLIRLHRPAALGA